MRLTRQARRRQGSLSWGLFRDTEQPGRHVEYFVDETWVEHLRRLAFHVGEQPPRVRRYVGEALEGGRASASLHS
ncbi:MFS transporter [Sphaerotilus sulfidivorans]|nr:hypothetical protein CQA4T8M7_10630 [Sphaerotilus natans]